MSKNKDKMPSLKELAEADLSSHGFRVKPGGQTKVYDKSGTPKTTRVKVDMPWNIDADDKSVKNSLSDCGLEAGPNGTLIGEKEDLEHWLRTNLFDEESPEHQQELVDDVMSTAKNV